MLIEQAANGLPSIPRHPAGDDGAATDSQREITAAIAETVDSRSAIEQAKGMLMFLFGIDAESAFDMLRAQSQQHNVKLRLIAEQVCSDLVELSQSASPLRRAKYDEVVNTAHRRVASGIDE